MHVILVVVILHHFIQFTDAVFFMLPKLRSLVLSMVCMTLPYINGTADFFHDTYLSGTLQHNNGELITDKIQWSLLHFVNRAAK